MDPVAAEGGNIEAPCIGQRLDDRAEERKRDKKKKKEKGELNELSKAASLPPPSLPRSAAEAAAAAHVCNGATSGPLFSPWLPPSFSAIATVVTLLAAVLVLPAADPVW